MALIAKAAGITTETEGDVAKLAGKIGEMLNGSLFAGHQNEEMEQFHYLAGFGQTSGF